MLALFYVFSGNARNLILAADGEKVVGSILLTRLVLALPLALLVLLLVAGVDFVTVSMTLVLLVRRLAEWFGEISLAKHEREHRVPATVRSIVVELAAFILCVALPPLAGMDVSFAMIPWAVAPFVALPGAKLSLQGWRRGTSWHTLMPHVGSTAVIGFSVYVFRISIALLVGKLRAGDLFTAFAIGGIVPTLFGQLLAPTLVHRVGSGGLPRKSFLAPLAMIVAGLTGVVALALSPSWAAYTGRSETFWYAIAWSVVGGAIMFVAVSLRTLLIQHGDGRSVFGPDLLSNLLIATCIPFVYHIIGPGSLAGLYALSASLSLMFMVGSGREWNELGRYRDYAMHALGFFLVLPVFFQLGGSIFRDASPTFTSGGNIFNVPIPLSVAVLFIGIAVLGNYAAATRSLTTIFFTGLLLVLEAIFVSRGYSGGEVAKLTLLAQYLLPIFALVLGEMYGHRYGKPLFERAALTMLVMIVPAQLIATWIQGQWMLVPSLFLFSIYQYLDYLPMVVVSVTLMVVFSLWRNSPLSTRLMSFGLPLVSVYVAATGSTTAICGLTIGLMVFIFVAKRAPMVSRTLRNIVFFSLLVGLCYGFMARHENKLYDSPPVEQGVSGVELSSKDSIPAQWRHYASGILESPSVFVFGHRLPPNREAHPSAHNYWLDALYNFGALAMAPLFALTIYTFRRIWRLRDEVFDSPMLLGTVLAATYLLLIENMFSVALRQSYSGIVSFFIWGLLLARLNASSRQRT